MVQQRRGRAAAAEGYGGAEGLEGGGIEGLLNDEVMQGELNALLKTDANAAVKHDAADVAASGAG
jgi:hypothetical protein